MKAWYGCPECGRCAESSRQLLAEGCEGKHERLMSVPEIKAHLRARASTLRALSLLRDAEVVEEIAEWMGSEEEKEVA